MREPRLHPRGQEAEDGGVLLRCFGDGDAPSARRHDAKSVRVDIALVTGPDVLAIRVFFLQRTNVAGRLGQRRL